MSNVKPFRHPGADEGDDPVVAIPDSAKLQKLVGDLVAATSAPTAKAPRDKEIRIRNFRSERFVLADDLIVVLEERDSHYLANSYDTGQYGYGHSPDDAIADLCSVLEDYFDLLNEDEDRLSPNLRAHLLYLRSILRERA